MIPRRIINLVGEIYLDYEIGQDCDGGIEIRGIESMTYLISNKLKGQGGVISGDLLQFRHRTTGETPAERINLDDLLVVTKREIEIDDEQNMRTLAEDRALTLEEARGIWEGRE